MSKSNLKKDSTTVLSKNDTVPCDHLLQLTPDEAILYVGAMITELAEDLGVEL